LNKKLAIASLILPLVSIFIVGIAGAIGVQTVQTSTTTSGPYDRIAIAIAAGFAVGMSSLAAAFAISSVGSAAVSALAEKPETFFRSFLVVALAEALAIYGLIMGILLWLKL